jgi:hypothetical protein
VPATSASRGCRQRAVAKRRGVQPAPAAELGTRWPPRVGTPAPGAPRVARARRAQWHTRRTNWAHKPPHRVVGRRLALLPAVLDGGVCAAKSIGVPPTRRSVVASACATPLAFQPRNCYADTRLARDLLGGQVHLCMFALRKLRQKNQYYSPAQLVRRLRAHGPLCRRLSTGGAASSNANSSA